MKKEDLTKEVLVAAGTDLNEVLEPNPPIVVALDETPFKGIALVNAKKKFASQLGKDLVEAAGLIAPTDVLEPATVDTLEILGVEGIREKVKIVEKGEGATETKKTEKVEKIEAVVKSKGKKKEGMKKESMNMKKESTKKELSRYGHRIGSQAAQLDDILFRGSMVDQAAVDLGVSKSRVKSHISYLQKKGVKIVKNEKTGVWIVVK